jgi:hypothetical protein
MALATTVGTFEAIRPAQARQICVTPLLGPAQFIEFGLAAGFLELNLVARYRQSPCKS